MYVRRNVRWRVVLRFAWKHVLLFAAWASLVTGVFLWFHERDIDISLPIAPLSTIGIAVAFYIGFKNNHSYDRFWEGRKIWGGIVNVSRSWANSVLTYVASTEGPRSDDGLVQQTLVYRHLAWINALRFQLRTPSLSSPPLRGARKHFQQATNIPAMKAELAALLPHAEINSTCSQKNTAAQLLRLQGAHLKRLVEDERRIEEFRLIAMMDLLTEMFALQGKCERIKNTPLPRQYAYFSGLFTAIFVALLPLGLVGEMATRGHHLIWLTVPLSTVVSWIFHTMEVVGDSSEDPFENFINDVPMTSMCRGIEIDLRQMLGETNVPDPLQPVGDILM